MIMENCKNGAKTKAEEVMHDVKKNVTHAKNAVKEKATHAAHVVKEKAVREVLPGNCAGKANSRTIGPASSCRFYGGVMPSGPTVLYEKGTEIRLPKGRRRVEVEGIGRNSVRRRFPAALFAK